MKHQIQISMRELLLVVFVAGLGMAGLSTGGWMAAVTVLLFIMMTMALAIVAFVGHGQLRAFAIGFLIPWLSYLGAHAYVGSSELDPYGKLPTTNLFRPVFERVVHRQYVDLNTGQPLPDYDPTKVSGLGGGGFAGGPAVFVTESPNRTTFMTLAHALCATALAYIGGKFAVWVNGLQATPKPVNEPTEGPKS